MGRLGALPVLILVLAACGGASTDTAACKGLPTAKRPQPPLYVSGTVPNLNKRGLCAQYGSPNSVTKFSHQRELWSYGNVTFELHRGRVNGDGSSSSSQ